ncbi:MAG: HAD family hydrolase [Bacilli bacterium]|nr:HAD family hydrolase [Bacilli bacterium]
MNKVIFLDRDGTINFDSGYLHEIEKFKFLPGVIDGLKSLQNMGFKLIIVTNQSGIERGFFNEFDYKILTDYMLNELEKEGIKIEKVYYCPHFFSNCNCRKPKLELFYKAKDEYDIDFSKSYAIGDKKRDLSICEKEKTKGILISSEFESIQLQGNIALVKNFKEAVLLIQKNETN